MGITLNKTEIFNKVANSGCDIFWVISHMNFTIWGCLNITQDMILQNWQTIIKTLSTCRKKKIILSQSIGVPLGMLWPPLILLLKIA